MRKSRIRQFWALLLLLLTVSPWVIALLLDPFLNPGLSFSTSNLPSAQEVIQHVNRANMWANALGIWLVLLITTYLLYLFKSSRLQSEKRNLWAIGLVLGNFVVMPFFWYLHIWRNTTNHI